MRAYLTVYFIVLSNFLFGQIDNPNNELRTILNKKWNQVQDEIKDKNKISFKQFEFDDSLTLGYISNYIKKKHPYYYVVFLYKGTIFRIAQIDDQTLYDRKGTIIKTEFDDSIQTKFSSYFLTKYHLKPDFDSIPKGIADNYVEFGLACGYSGQPTEVGSRYENLKNSNLTTDQIRRLISSFSKKNRMLGLLLFDKEKHLDLIDVFQDFASREQFYNYCDGCEPYLKTPTIIEIRKMINNHTD